MVVEIRRRLRASAKSEPSFLRERFTGRGNDLDDRDRIMFNISHSTGSTVQILDILAIPLCRPRVVALTDDGAEQEPVTGSAVQPGDVYCRFSEYYGALLMEHFCLMEHF